MKILIICVLVGYVLYKLSTVKIYTNTHQGYQSPKPEGHTEIKTPPTAKPKRSTFKGGDYVDYEEIK